jgi:hypothetical protein
MGDGIAPGLGVGRRCGCRPTIGFSFEVQPDANGQKLTMSGQQDAKINRLFQELAWEAVTRHPLCEVKAKDK